MSFNEVHEWLRKNGVTVGNEARAGNKQAQSIIDAYKMHHDQPNDPGALGVLAGAIEQFKGDL